MRDENTKAGVRSLNDNMDFFDIVAGILQGDILAAFFLYSAVITCY